MAAGAYAIAATALLAFCPLSVGIVNPDDEFSAVVASACRSAIAFNVVTHVHVANP